MCGSQHPSIDGDGEWTESLSHRPFSHSLINVIDNSRKNLTSRKNYVCFGFSVPLAIISVHIVAYKFSWLWFYTCLNNVKWPIYLDFFFYSDFLFANHIFCINQYAAAAAAAAIVVQNAYIGAFFGLSPLLLCGA